MRNEVRGLSRVATEIRVRDFQRNAAFVAFIFIACFAGFIYVTKSLRGVLVPLVWSGFFAVPLTGLTGVMNQAVIKVMGCLMQPFGRREMHETVHFSAMEGENVLTLESSPAVIALLDRANHPLNYYCGGVFSRIRLGACCRRRVRIMSLERDGVEVEDAGLEVNRLVRNWSYYIRDPWYQDARPVVIPAAASSSSGSCAQAFNPLSGEDVEGRGVLHVELFIDLAERYPAVIRTRASEIAPPAKVSLSGTLEIDRTSSSLSWFVAVMLSLGLVVLGVVLFVIFVSLGATALQDNREAYLRGANELLVLIGSYVQEALPEEVWKGMDKKARVFLEDSIADLAKGLLLFVEGIGWQALLFLLYLCFWLFEPLPVNSSVAHVFESYFLLKTLVCLLFAALMSALLFVLDCKFWHLFFLITFVLNYIPEIGPLAAAALMVPSVLLDGNKTVQHRYGSTFWLFVFGMLFKIITGNIIEVRMYATRGGEFMRMHPVILMALMMFCEQLMGITGMFLAVPIMAAVKYFLVSADMPNVYLNPLLMLLEGDEHGPHKNFVDRHRVDIKAREQGFEAELSRELSETGESEYDY